MKRRLLALTLILCLGLVAPALAANSDFTIKNGVLVEYTGSDENVVIPDGVTEISYSAFDRCRHLTSVVIPNSVTKIGYAAFSYCSGLTSVTIPGSVTEIGEYAFWNCPDLTIYGTAGSYAQTYARENDIPFVALEKRKGTMGESAAKQLDWTCDELGQVAVTGQLAEDEMVLVAGYDARGRLTEIQAMTRSAMEAKLKEGAAKIKLFWLGTNQKPVSESAVAWDAEA